MPTIKDKIHFNYDGLWSNEFEVINVVLDSGMYEENFIKSGEIKETTIRGREEPLYIGKEKTPIEFEMVIAFINGFNDEKIDNVIRWIFTEDYRPLFFENNENKIFYCMPFGEPSLVHNGFGGGYIKLSMRCNSPYLYSPFFTTNKYTLSNNETRLIELDNSGHIEIKPEISIRKINDGDILIISKTNGDKIFEIKGLANGEDIYINCEKEIIETDIVGVYRFDNLLGEFLVMKYGINRFEITGDCEIRFRYRWKYRF